MAGFVAAAVVIDAAVQVNQITGQSIIFALSASARSRINAAYMTVTFFVGAMGSLIGTATFEAGGWWASALAGAGIAGTALAVFLLFDRGASLAARQQAAKRRHAGQFLAFHPFEESAASR